MQGLRNCFKSLGVSLAITLACASAVNANDAAKVPRSIVTPLQASDKAKLSTELDPYFGANKKSYLPRTGSTFDQFLSVILANANKQVLGDGDVLITSVDAENDKVRASVLLGPDGGIKGAALIHYNCRADGAGNFGCSDDMHPTMTIFLSTYDANDSLTNMFVIGKFRKWANSSIHRIWGKESPQPTAVKVQVQQLHTAAPAIS